MRCQYSVGINNNIIVTYVGLKLAVDFALIFEQLKILMNQLIRNGCRQATQPLIHFAQKRKC